MADTERYQLIVSYDGTDSNDLTVYMSLLLDGGSIPSSVKMASDHISSKDVTRLRVAVDDDFREVQSVVRIYSSDEWLLQEIEEVNKHNKKLQANRGKKSRIEVPMPDDVIVDLSTWEFVISSIKIGLYPLFTGPTGCGKTILARGIAQALGYDFLPINCGSLFKPKQDLIGSVQAREGSTFLVESEFMTHFTSDRPTIIFLDEISRIPQAAANSLMTITDREQAYIYVPELGKRVFKGKDVIFIAAANFGIQYTDTRRLDEALMDRFIYFHLNYLGKDDEARLINRKVPGLNPVDVSRLVEQINVLRRNNDTLGKEISHRHSIDLARYFTMGFSLSEICNTLLINMFVNGNDDRREQAEQILNGKISSRKNRP